MTDKTLSDEEIEAALDAVKNKDDDTDDIVDDDDDVQVSVAEQASKIGWKPEEEWDGDPNEWIDATEFMARYPLYQGLGKQSKVIKKLRRQLAEMQTQFKGMSEIAYDKAKKDLDTQYQQAIQNGDLELVNQLREEETKLTKQQNTTTSNADLEKELYEEWIGENPWYKEDITLKYIADGIASNLVDENPKMPLDEILEEVNVKMKELQGTGLVKKEKAKALPPNSRRSRVDKGRKSSKTLQYTDLSSDEKTVYRQMVKTESNPHGVFTGEEYLKLLHETKERYDNRRGV